MYDIRPNLILGFHGCDIITRDHLLNNPDNFKISKEPYDWLGHGMYFWENNYERALQWAKDKKKLGKLTTPAVVGAVLQLGYCCDFLDSRFIQMLQFYYKLMADSYLALGDELPHNKDLPQDQYKDKILRELDCTTIEFMHAEIASQIKSDLKQKGFSDYTAFDSTRGMFTEGGPAFVGAGIFEKSHIQICVRNPNCIQGFFLPRKDIDFSKWLEGK